MAVSESLGLQGPKKRWPPITAAAETANMASKNLQRQATQQSGVVDQPHSAADSVQGSQPIAVAG